ncbi:MAG: DMT family transporter [Treponema sp.]|nr:DMT family transporter [Treponema sp.]
MEKTGKIPGYILAAISIFIWGITFVSTKALLNYFSSLEIMFIRYTAAYIGLWIIRPKILKLNSKKDEIIFSLAGLTGVTLYQFTENVAINFTTASNVSIIVSICPMFTAIISQLFLKEKHINFWFVIGFIIALTGIALVSFNGKTEFQLNPKGDFLALVAGISWGFYSMFVSIINKKGYESILCTRRYFFYAIIWMIPLLIWGALKKTPDATIFVNLSVQENLLRFARPMNWVNLLFLGFGASAFCFVAWNIVCNSLGTVKATVGIYLIPVVTIIFAFIFLGEKITWMGLLGTALTITGLFLSGKKTATPENSN